MDDKENGVGPADQPIATPIRNGSKPVASKPVVAADPPKLPSQNSSPALDTVQGVEEKPAAPDTKEIKEPADDQTMPSEGNASRKAWLMIISHLYPCQINLAQQ